MHDSTSLALYLTRTTTPPTRLLQEIPEGPVPLKVPASGASFTSNVSQDDGEYGLADELGVDPVGGWLANGAAPGWGTRMRFCRPKDCDAVVLAGHGDCMPAACGDRCCECPQLKLLPSAERHVLSPLGHPMRRRRRAGGAWLPWTLPPAWRQRQHWQGRSWGMMRMEIPSSHKGRLLSSLSLRSVH